MAITREEARLLLELADRLEPAVRKAFLEAISAKASSLSVAEIEAALRQAIATGDASRLANLLQLSARDMFPVSESIRTAYIAGMQAGANGLSQSLVARFGFGGNPRAVAAVEAMVTNLTGDVTQGQVDMTRDLVRGAVDSGVPVRTMALEIVGRKNAAGVREGGYLGLDAQRAGQASKVSAMLRDKDAIKDYFIGNRARYTTTDRRYDARVLRAIREGRGLTAAEAEPIIKAHMARLLKNRADTIARHETLNALRNGNMDGFRELVASGAVREDRIERTWLATKDARTRHDHVLMNGQKVRGLSQPFTFPDGSQALYPGDESLFSPAENLIQCRCTQLISVKRPGD